MSPKHSRVRHGSSTAAASRLVREIQGIVRGARTASLRAVNFAMVEAYWRIGERIVREEQAGRSRAGYGERLIHAVSRRLTSKLGRGFSEANLRNFRQFYLVYPSRKIRYALRSELSWSHHRVIMRVESAEAREYYMREAAEQHWSTRQLERNVNSLYFERQLVSKGKRRPSPKPTPLAPAEHFKDPYVLEFLGLPMPPGFNEAEFEEAIIGNLQRFLLELGKGFSFVGRQYRISTETKHFFVDLVFYNFVLKCFVLIDLKVGELTHQDIGQMDMYVRLFEGRMRGKNDNATIGLILCTEKDETIVRYSVLEENKRLFASKYRVMLPSEDELRHELDRERHLLLGAGSTKSEHARRRSILQTQAKIRPPNRKTKS